MLSDSELEVLASLRDMKASYKEQYGELQAARSEVEYTQALVETCRQELLADFTEWKAHMHITSQVSSPPSASRSSHDVGYIAAARGDGAVNSDGAGSRAQAGGRQGAVAAGGMAAAAGSRGSTPPLASLLGSLDSDGGDPEAVAYYQAQQNSRLAGAVGLKAGAMKKVRTEKGTFSNTERSNITQMIARTRLDTE